jgi:hypothetical protein
MAKKIPGPNSDRTDPRKNMSLAIRTILKRTPKAKASEVVAAVKKEFGHDVKNSMVYMVKTKANMAADGRPRRPAGSGSDSPIGSAAQWVEAIKLARQLLKATGSVANATALLKAIEG